MQQEASDYREYNQVITCALYNCLRRPAVLPCGRPNTWLLEVGIGPSDDLPPIRRDEGRDGEEYSAYTLLTLWDAKLNQSAATKDFHRLRGYGRVDLLEPPTMAKGNMPHEKSSNIKGRSSSPTSFDIGRTLLMAIVCTFTNASFPGILPSMSQPASVIADVIAEFCRTSECIAPHTILVHDRSLADVLSKMIPEGLSVEKTFVRLIAIRISKTKKEKYQLRPNGQNSQIPVICAHCQLLGVANHGTLDEKFKIFWRCSDCATAWYCNRECQRAHWANGHKRERAGGKGQKVELGECTVVEQSDKS